MKFAKQKNTDFYCTHVLGGLLKVVIRKANAFQHFESCWVVELRGNKESRKIVSRGHQTVEEAIKAAQASIACTLSYHNHRILAELSGRDINEEKPQYKRTINGEEVISVFEKGEKDDENDQAK